MKKKLFVSLACLGMFISGCGSNPFPSGGGDGGESEHVHTFADFYSYDENCHWRASTCGHPYTITKEAHDYEDTVIPATTKSEGYTLHECKVCDYEYKDNYTEIITYTITWVNWDGEVLEIDTNVYAGTTPSYDGAEPEKPSDNEYDYVFKGWEESIRPVDRDRTYTAEFEQKQRLYTVSWVDEDGSLIYEESYTYNETPSYKNQESELNKYNDEYQWIFEKWEPALSNVTSNITYTATYRQERRQYVVHWIDDDDTELSQELYYYGDHPTYKDAAPAKESSDPGIVYEFTGWYPEIHSVNGEIYYRATYTGSVPVYTITWKNWDGEVLISESYEYGKTPSYKGEEPTREDESAKYIFNGWDKEIQTVTGDIDYIATYKVGYEIIWKNWDEEILFKEIVEEGTLPSYEGEEPTKVIDNAYYSYTFTGWSPTIVSAQSNTTYVAQFNEQCALSFEDYEDGLKLVGVNLPNVKEFTVPSTWGDEDVISIGKNAFYDCKSLEKLTIPESIVIFEQNALNNIPTLKTLVTPFVGKTRNSIADNEHDLGYLCGGYNYMCAAENITVYDWENIGIAAFTYTNNLKHLTLTGSVEYVDFDAFSYCRALETVDFSDSVATISNFAFAFCSSLKTLEINASTIKTNAFRGCSSLNTINFKNNSVHLDAASFDDCDGVEEVYLKEGFINDGAFTNCGSDFDTYIQYTSIASIFDGESRNELGNNIHLLDENDNEITSIVVPSDIIDIPDYAFNYCSFISEVTLHENIESIGKGAFNKCKSLNKINDFENTKITFINYSTFSDCDSLENITIPDGVTSIGNQTFYCCDSLISVTLPNSLITIGEYAFHGCTSLETINLEQVHTISANAFSLCLSLNNIDLNNTLEIGLEAFSFCISLESVYLPHITSIGRNAFIGCSSLKSIYVPANISNIGEGAFENCNAITDLYVHMTSYIDFMNLTLKVYLNCNVHLMFEDTEFTDAYIPEDVTEIPDYAFYNCTSIRTFHFHSKITKYGQKSFYNCQIRAIHFSEIVTTVGFGAFYGCPIEEITLNFIGDTRITNTFFGYIFGASSYEENEQYVPITLTTVNFTSKVYSIPEHAFYGCSSLTSLVIPGTVNNIKLGAFEGCSSLVSITVPFIGEAANKGFHIGYIFGASKSSDSNKYVPTSLKTIIVASTCTSLPDYAFYGCQSVTDIQIETTKVKYISSFCFAGTKIEYLYIPSTVNEIKNGAFNSCNSLKAIYMDYNCGSIANGTPAYSFAIYYTIRNYDVNDESTFANISSYLNFNGKSYLTGCSIHLLDKNGVEITDIIFPETYSVISQYMFSRLVSIKSVTLHANTTTLLSYAFYGCISLEHVNIEETKITIINERAFYSCGSLKSITFKTGTSQIAASAFFACRSLTSIDLLNISSIGNGAFENCSSLTSVVLPTYLTTVSDYMFYKCSSLSSVTFGNKVTTIGTSAFAFCSSLTSIDLPISITTFTAGAFAYSPIETLSAGRAFNLFGNTPGDSLKTIIFKEGMTSLEGILSNYTSLETVELPSTLTSIGNYVFNNCTSLKNVIIPEGLTSIGDYSFRGCTSLISMALPNSLITIGSYAFYNCTSLETINLEQVHTIGVEAFWGCSSLKTVTTGATLGNGVFYNCTSLTTITIYLNSSSNSLKSAFGISSTTPNPNTTLKEIIVGNGSTALPYEAFRYFAGLETIILPNTLVIIDGYAFSDCHSLKSVVVPDSVKTINAYAFYNCTSLEELTIPFVGKDFDSSKNADFAKVFGFIFGYSTKASQGDQEYQSSNGSTYYYYIPATLKTVTVTGGEISDKAFYKCKHIETVILKEGITKIGNWAFLYHTSLVSVVLPSTITSIGDNAFNGCTSLQYVFVGQTRIADWRDIPGHNWIDDSLLVFYSEEKPTNPNYNYWHYVDNKPVIWEE